MQLCLLDYLYLKLKLPCLSDIHRLDTDQQVQLLHILGGIAPESADLREWNDALDYIVGLGPATSAEEAKQLLIKSLGG